MRNSVRRLQRFSVCAAAALVTGCGAPQQLPAGSLAAPPAQSWMLKEASSEPLLYIIGSDGVAVVSYPQGKLVGALKDNNSPQGLCSDANGNVFVTEYVTEDVLEFAHGGTQPIAKLGDYGYYPFGCAIDPTTGNLAVANYNSMNGSGGNVAIYANAQGKPTDYTAPGFGSYSWCAYDDQGNLLVDGDGSGYAEMPAGSNSFNDIDLELTGQGIQWDGAYFAIIDPAGKQVNRVSISGSYGHVVSTVNVTGLITTLGYDFVIAGDKIVLPYSVNRDDIPSKVARANYPGGGRLGKPFKIGGGDYDAALTLSY